MTSDALVKLLDKRREQRGVPSEVRFDACGSWPESAYLLDQHSLDALIAAVGAGRPVLVIGEPGTGKSLLARAAAELTGRPFISTVIQPQSEHEDLLWSVDLTQRLGEAQLHAMTNADEHDRRRAREALGLEHFVCPGPLWYAFDPTREPPAAGIGGYRPEAPVGTDAMPDTGVVLLVDEIDKADPTLCHGLLEALGNGGFRVPPLGMNVGSRPGREPLIIITSNDTRDLPPAFLRRCVLLELAVADEDFEAHLDAIGTLRFKDELPAEVRHAAAALVTKERRLAARPPRAGEAEYVDLLNTLVALRRCGEELDTWLDVLGQYFSKHR